LMQTISDMVQQIDVATTDVTELRVFKLVHADPVELADQLGQLFPDTSKSADNTGGGGFGFRFGGPFGRGGLNQTTSNDRSKKKSQVLAVADPRTSSLLVSAASELMPHIAEMITQLDSVDARHEVVKVFDLRNADPQDVNQVLADLFNRSGQMRSSSSSSQTLLGTRNPLYQRETATITSPSTQNSSSSRGAAGINTGF
jgi:type II secretory pathway component GspD/PulD (secretin)